MTEYSVSVDCSCEGGFFVLHFGVVSPAYDLVSHDSMYLPMAMKW